jgi:hypothetical protein
LKRRTWIRDKRLVYGDVKYYDPESSPDAAWAVPEQIAMNKPKTYERQAEYRICFALNDAFNLKNIRTQIVTVQRHDVNPLINHAEHILKIGNLERICACSDVQAGSEFMYGANVANWRNSGSLRPPPRNGSDGAHGRHSGFLREVASRRPGGATPSRGCA